MLLGAVSRDQDDDLRQPVPAHKCEMLDRSVEPDDIGTALFDLDARMQRAVGAKAVFHLKPAIAGGLKAGQPRRSRPEDSCSVKVVAVPRYQINQALSEKRSYRSLLCDQRKRFDEAMAAPDMFTVESLPKP